MPKRLTIGTFNVENLFVYHRLRKNGLDLRFRSKPASLKELGYKGMGVRSTALQNGFWVEKAQRKTTARAIVSDNPDIVALQEIEGLETLRKFRGDFIDEISIGGNHLRYPYALSIDGNDPLLIDVGVLSQLPIAEIRTHMFATRKTGKRQVPVFPRDCLEVDFWVDGEHKQILTLYVNHFTSRLSDEKGDKRNLQAKEVIRIIRKRFGPKLDGGDFIVCGDLNDTPSDHGVAPLYEPSLGLHDVIAKVPQIERWTHFYYSDSGKPRELSQLDHFLVSPSLWKKNGNGSEIKVKIEKRALLQTITKWSEDKTGPLPKPFKGVTSKPGTEGSDHCPVYVSLLV